MRTGYVVSDLHMFAERSVSAEYARELHAAASSAEFFVFNGDIFDFRWSTLPSLEATLDAAEAWLTGFAGKHVDCQFFYILGNHDCLEEFAERLVRISERLPNFSWHPAHLALGNAIFLHGDLPLSRRDSRVEGRRMEAGREPKSALLGQLYRLLVKVRMHRVVAISNTRRRVSRRVTAALESETEISLDGISDVYLGHTHVSFTNHRHRGINFHNTGSAVRNAHFNPLPVVLECSTDNPVAAGEE